MSLRKSRPVLYEVVRRGGARDPSLPRRDTTLQISPADAGAPPSAEAAGAEENGRAAQATPTTTPPIAATPTAQPRLLVRTPPPFFRMADGRVQLTLHWAAVAAAVLVFLAAPIWAYRIGANRAPKPPANAGAPAASVEQGGLPDLRRGGNPAETKSGSEILVPSQGNPPKVAVPSKSPDAPPQVLPETANKEEIGPARNAVEPPKAQFQKGHHYVVIQHFRKSEREAAREAAEFLQTHGVGCFLDDRSVDLRLIATEPFLIDQEDAAAAREQKQRCEQLKQKIKQIGRDYVRTKPNGYTFRDCEERKF